MTEPTRYIDRETGSVEEERIYGQAALEFAYQTGLGRAIMKLLPHRASSALYGWLRRLPASSSEIPRFIESLGIDADEAELPIGQYRSLDAFFCRRLTPDARPIDETLSRFVSPADGRTLVLPRIEHDVFTIKGSRVCLADLLADPGEAERYRHGTAIIVRLAPCDYHRFHFPDSGEASLAARVGGRLHSVHPIALLNGAPSFRNKRHITRLASDHFGTVTLVEIGAMAVGTIIQTYRPGRVRRGQEKGYFRFGGSTIVVLLTADRIAVDIDLVEASATGLETFTKMGSSIGTALP